MKKVLVADDEEILRMLIVDTLEDSGYEIDTAEDGKEALKCLEENKYDLAILDYMMPGLTGIEVLKGMDLNQKNEMKIIMLTAKAQESDRVTAINSGADIFMAKPFSPVSLLNTVNEVLR